MNATSLPVGSEVQAVDQRLRERAAVFALGEEIAQAAAVIDAATHALCTKLRGFDERSGWYQQGAVSCAQWLSWRTGLSPCTARDRVRVAKALGQLPAIDAAFGRGELSYAKVRALVRIATPEKEAELVVMARTATAAQLEKVCRLVHQCQARSAGEAREQEQRRWLSRRETGRGTVLIQIEVTAEEGARVMEAVRASAGAAGGALVDGLLAMAEATLRGERADRPPVEVTVHVDAETLQGSTKDGETGVSAEAARRLCCDAGLVPLVEGQGGEVLGVGRKTRSIPTPLRRALTARNQGCRFPGCTCHRFVDGHHIKHWSDGGATDLENLVLLCSRHHRYVHELGFRVERLPDGGLQFCDRDGTVLLPDRPVRLSPNVGWLDAARMQGWVPAPEVTEPRWDGDPVDYDWAVHDLLRSERD